MNECHKQFEEWLSKLNMQPDDFGHYWLDEGNLYWLYSEAYQAALAALDTYQEEAGKQSYELGIVIDYYREANRLLDETLRQIRKPL